MLNGGTLQLNNDRALGTGLLVARETATLTSASYLDLSNDIRIASDLTLNVNNLISLKGHLSGSGNLIKHGLGVLEFMNLNNTFSGNIDLVQGNISTIGTNALGNPGNINLGANTTLFLDSNQSIGALTGSGILNTASGTIVALGGSNLGSVFAGALQGRGSFDKQGSGSLELAGNSDQFNNASANQVTAGTLKVTGTLGGSNTGGLYVGPGATLTGSGTVNGNTTIDNGGHLAGISGQTLTLNSLTLSPFSNIDVALGFPRIDGGVPLFDVSNDLTLDGVVNITDAGGFGNGVYSLFNYGGNLIVNGATFGTTPNNLPAAYMALQTAIAGQVNLVVNSPDTTVQFWNGTQGTADGAIHGGSGLWDSTRTNWTSTDGNANRDWAGQFAVFMGTPGVVTVDGPQAVSGMQFMSDGYLLQPDVNGPLNTSNGNGAFFVVRTDPNVTATLSLPLIGSGHLNKMDTGTLVLNGDNSYAGGTTLSQGTLVLGHDNALGSGVLNTTAGTSLDSNTALTLANAMNVAGQLTLNGSNDLTLNGAISGAGQLTKNGNASLTLTGNNSYSGGTALNAGRLTLGHANALGTGELTITNYASQLDTLSAMTVANNVKLNGTLTVGGAHDLTLSGQVSGSASGSLAKEGDNTLTLNGDNSFGGGITLKQGTLRLGNANALGKGGLLVMGTGSLETSSAMALANNVSMILGSSALTLNVSHDLTLNGKLSASSGSLTKNGSGVLTLNHDNSAMTASMTVGEGSLVVNHILGSQDVRVNGNASLSGTGELTGAVTLANEANLNLRDGSLLKVGSLALDSGSNLNVALGTSLALAPALLKVANNLTLAGKLNVTDLGGFGAGTYRLIDYGGSLNNQGLMVNTLPNGLIAADVQVQTAIDKQINLVVGGPGNIAFWNGSQQAPNGSITGGEGLWNATNTNWTDANGKFGQAWSDTFAVFSGNAGTVVVNGMQTISGMQFTTNGYTIKGWAGGRLISTGAGNIRVDRDVSAILDVAILGSGSMIKLDAGKLVLSGTNFYTGVTDIREGILQVGNGGTTGSLGGGAVSNAGQLVFQRSDALTVANDISGTGSLVQAGTGITTLTGTNTYTGGTTVAAGTLRAGSATALQQGASYQVLAGATLDLNGYALQTSQLQSEGSVLLGSADLTLNNAAGQTSQLNGQVSGNGQLIKQGQGRLVLGGANVYTGATDIREGILQVGNGGTTGSLGSGAVSNAGQLVFQRSDALTVANNINGTGSLVQAGSGITTLAGTNTYTGATDISNGVLQVGNGGTRGNLGSGAVSNAGQLVFQRSDALTVANDISGTGSLVQAGTGITTLTGTNTYTGGTTVAAGTLQAGSATALQQGASYQVQAGATLDLNGYGLQTSQLQSDGRVLLGSADLTLNSAAGQASQLNGQVSGTGQLIKQGQGTLALNGAHLFSGGVKLKQGNISLGHEQGLGTGTLAMDDYTSITLTGQGMTIANALHMTGKNDPIIDTGVNNATWAGSITGAGFLTKQGAGTLTLSSTANTYTGATDIAQGTLQAGAANSLSSTSAHTVAAGAVLNLGGYSQSLSSLNNSGLVMLSQLGTSTPGTVLTLTGPYVGNSGTLGLSTVLGADGSATDRLLLSGATAIASGSTSLQITNAGGLGAQTTGTGIELVTTANGASLQAGSFTLAGGKIDAGAFEYRLTQTSQGASLHSTTTPTPTPTPTPTYRAEVPLLSAMPAQLRQADMAMLGDMRRRTGDDTPQVNGVSQDATQSAFVDPQRRVWSRALRISPKIAQQGTVNPDSSGHLTGFQVGLDILARQNTQAGLYVGQLSGDMDVSGFASGVSDKHVGRNKLRNRYLGVYGSWQADSGVYAEGVVQAAEYRSSLQTVSVNGVSTGATTKGHGWLASLEVGKPFVLNANWQIEPQAQIVYSKLDLDDTRINNAVVQNKTDDNWTLRVGARLKGSFETRAGVLQPYGRVNLYKANNSTDVASFITPTATTDIAAQGGYTATELAAGASLQLNKRISLYGEVGRLWANGGDSRVKSGIQGSVGVKVLW